MEITQGNLSPEIRVAVGDVDFSGASKVTLRGRRDGAVVFTISTVEGDGGVIATSSGVVVAPWPDGSTDTVGRIQIEVVASWPSGDQSYWPDDVFTVIAAPMQFVTVTELSDHMSGATFTDAQERDAERVLRGLTRNLERKLARGFTEGLETESVYAAEDGWALLSRSPVKSVVTVDGVAAVLAPSFWGAPRVTHGGVAGLSPLTWHVVTYRGGGGLNENDLDDVRFAILDKAAGIMTNRHDDTVTVKDLDTQQPVQRPRELHWTRDELEQFDRLRRKIVL